MTDLDATLRAQRRADIAEGKVWLRILDGWVRRIAGLLSAGMLSPAQAKRIRTALDQYDKETYEETAMDRAELPPLQADPSPLPQAGAHRAPRQRTRTTPND